LSIPQEKVPFWFKPILFLFGLLPGVALVFISLLYAAYFASRLLTNPSDLLIPMLFGLVLGLVWMLWMYVPLLLVRWLRRRRHGRA
jgi:hypothetical protein